MNNIPSGLLAYVKLLGIYNIRIEFDGSGDSGSINDVYFFDRNNEQINVEEERYMWAEPVSIFKNGQWQVETTPEKLELIEDVFKSITSVALDETQLDWYNNDGGYGEFTIDLATSPPEIKLEVNIRTTQIDENTFRYGVDGDAPAPPFDDVS